MNTPIKEGLEKIPGVVTSWGRVLSLKDAYKYSGRHIASITAYLMQVLRLIEPDYKKRTLTLCQLSSQMINMVDSPDFKSDQRKEHQIPDNVPHGNYIGGLTGHEGDEAGLMAGRVQEFTPERVEKELDTCPWDIVGSELCRMTTAMFSGYFDMNGEKGAMAVDMCEARGCGDMHCRIVAEDKKKYFRADQDLLDHFGTPLGKNHVTPREECLSETQVLRTGKFVNPFGKEHTIEEFFHRMNWQGWIWSVTYLMISINELAQDPKKVENTIRAVFETAGKASFIEVGAIKGVRDWLGVPGEVNDGRVLGSLFEVILDVGLVPYTVKEFNADRVRLDIDRSTFIDRGGVMPVPELIPAYESLLKGMAKTLISAEWSAWFTNKETDENMLHLIIERKIDKYC